MTIEFQLARITAQSKNADPKKIKGGLPDLTPDDIRAAVSMTNSPVSYHALMAKYCESELSIAAMLEILEDASMRRFLREYPRIRINGHINRRLIESVMIHFLSPAQGSRRGDRGNAIHCQVSRKTWVLNYKPHFHYMVKFLFTHESYGLTQVQKKLRAEQWQMSPVTIR